MIEEVVVGVDDSPSARAALQWAVNHARGTNLRLRAIHVITPMMYGPLSWSAGYAGMATIPDPSIKEELRAQLENLFQSIRPEPTWHLQYEEGSVGPVLIRESEAARLLVIGTQEHTGIGRIVTGSISHYCLSHARCPVVAVPAGESSLEASRLEGTP